MKIVVQKYNILICILFKIKTYKENEFHTCHFMNNCCALLAHVFAM